MEEHIFVNFNAPPGMIRLTTYIDSLEPPLADPKKRPTIFCGFTTDDRPDGLL